MLNKPETSKIGECEVCPKTDIEVTVHYGNLWMCDECWNKELALKSEMMKPENVERRVQATRTINIPTAIDSKLIENAKAIDNSATMRTDLFNAETVAIIDIKKAIDSDDTITNKPAKLAEVLLERFNTQTALVFELGEKLQEAGTKQKAIHIYLNQLANSLRAEEREKYKISDINYKPNAPSVKTIKPIKTKAPKLDKAELRKYAAELGVAEFTLQSFVVSKGITVAEAAAMIRKSIEAAKATS